MEKYNIIYVDDQREVLSTIEKDLQLFEKHLEIEGCESADEAMELLDEIDSRGDFAALIISDHVMPKKNGIDFLTDINNDERFTATKKILLTGMATHQDTITAINKANIDRYFEKPWKSDELIQVVKELLTTFILNTGLDYKPYNEILDQPTLLNQMKNRIGKA